MGNSSFNPIYLAQWNIVMRLLRLASLTQPVLLVAVLGKVAAAEQCLQKGSLSMDSRWTVLSTMSVVLFRCCTVRHPPKHASKQEKPDTFLAKVLLALMSASRKT